MQLAFFNMTLTNRRILFILFVMIFIVAGIALIYYTRGYRFDFSTYSITKTGAVYIEASQREIQIYLGKNAYPDKSGILKKGTLISNVIPKKYNLVIKKDGYYDYQKNIEVLPSQVVQIINVYLIPKKITPSPISKSVKGDAIIDVSADGRMLVSDSLKGIYYLYDLSDESPVATNFSSKLSALTRQKISAVWFYPQTDAFIIKTSKGLYKADIPAKTISAIQEGTIGTVRIDGNNLYAVIQNPPVKTKTSPASSSAPSKISVFDLVLGSKISEFSLPFQTDQIKTLDVSNDSVAMLLSNGSIFLYDLAGKQTAQIAHSARKASVSEDNSKLFFQDSDGKVFVYLFNEEFVPLGAAKNSTLRLMLVNSAHIENVWWFTDSFHILVQYPDKIMLAEITSKDPNEHFPITASLKNVFYSPLTKTLYTLDGGELEGIDMQTL
jgi:hypothetical protein